MPAPQVSEALLAAEARCEEFKARYAKFDFLWKKDMHEALRVGARWEGATWVLLLGACSRCVCC